LARERKDLVWLFRYLEILQAGREIFYQFLPFGIFKYLQKMLILHMEHSKGKKTSFNDLRV